VRFPAPSLSSLPLLAVVALLATCGGDDTTTTVTVTTTAAGSQPPPTGPAIAELQQVMTTLGYYSGPIDGVYGDQTTAAVKEMQSALGVTADGIYGEEPHAALKGKAKYITVQIQTALQLRLLHRRHRRHVRPPRPQLRSSNSRPTSESPQTVGFGPESAAAFNEAVASGELQPA
jgi:peptidoglycan hydrolase-like protein with peptidoglycan-binding domain